MSPLVVVEGPVFVGDGRMLRTAHRPPPSLFGFRNIRTLPSIRRMSSTTPLLTGGVWKKTLPVAASLERPPFDPQWAWR